jgi:hypothetical protein
MKILFTFLTAILLLSGCSHHSGSDAELTAQIVGTWTTADVILPDQAKVSDIVTVDNFDGSYISRYTITRAGNSRQQTTSGRWQVESGIFYEQQTNVDGVTDSASQRGGSTIIQIDGHEMVLSNWYSPSRVFSRKP